MKADEHTRRSEVARFDSLPGPITQDFYRTP